MELEVTQENLSKALQNASRIAQSKTPLPILSNILLRTDGNRLQVSATNLELASTTKIGAKITKQGEITVPARLITEFVQNLPKQNVNLKMKGDQLVVSSNHYTSTINGTISDEFPELPEVSRDSSTSLSLPTLEAKEAFTQTIITASSDATRPVLTGVYWHTVDDLLVIAATDGYRLAERTLSAKNVDIKAIVPTSTLQEVLRVISDDSADIEITINDTEIHFEIDDTTITSRLIDGSFPDYRQLIPASSDISATIKKQDFSRLTKIVSLFARVSGGGVTIEVDKDTSLLSVHSIASEVGENTSEASITDVSSSGKTTLNSRYLTDALNVLQGEDITVKYSENLSPIILNGRSGYTHIIMPLKN